MVVDKWWMWSCLQVQECTGVELLGDKSLVGTIKGGMVASLDGANIDDL